ncbi:MAG: glycine/sarcosine/betaine reductase complex component C subunit beta [Desulfovibrionaceae bacterium]|nr:glycine/sarcosine/betaine reductase complex component C subunit beta [Desulfovibrionaceae bacterium]
MATAAMKSASYCLVHAPEMGLRYGTTPYQEYYTQPDSAFLADLEKTINGAELSYEAACRYAPHLTYIGAMTTDELAAHPRPFLQNPYQGDMRFGSFGEIMPEDEFIGLMDICDAFDLIWLKRSFASAIKAKLEAHPLIAAEQIKLLEAGHDPAEIDVAISNNHALPFYFHNELIGCCRRAHERDANLSAHVLLENIASKAGAVLALLHLMQKSGIKPSGIDFVVDCSEEAVGDMNQRGGGNIAKAIAESAGCSEAGGFDLRAFCAAPVAAVIAAASMVAAGVHRNVVVVSGGSVPKLFMNAREHIKKGLPPLENVMGCFAVLVSPDEGKGAIIRLDAIGKHNVASGSSPQAVTTALVFDPLQAAGLQFADVDKYAPELHDPEVTVPAGAGNVPEANFKMIAALAVMKGQCEREGLAAFVEKHSIPGFAPTQGHIPSGIPYIGHAIDAINKGKLNRAMIIGKGSLFLGRLTNLADGASFLMEKSTGGIKEQAMDKQIVDKARHGRHVMKIGLMAVGSELGRDEVLRGGRLAQAANPFLRVVVIGPRLPGFEDMEWIETPDCEADIAATITKSLQEDAVAGAVAMHYPFPIGVATIGRIVTPWRGYPMFISSCTGSTAALRQEALLRNAVYGVAAAKACGLAEPAVAFLNIDGAGSVLRAFERMRKNGYAVRFGASKRNEGGQLLRGNDLVHGAADVLVCDTLTGNALIKIFSTYTTGGFYESSGWGYGPSAGEGWNNIISIISRASGAQVIANALSLTAQAIAGQFPRKVAEELKAARKAGFDAELYGLKPKTEREESIAKPAVVPLDAEISGVDVLDMDKAVQALWKENIYAEAVMGCTGPVVRVQASVQSRAAVILRGVGLI